MADFPALAEDLSAKWLSGALGYPVQDFTIERFGEGAGLVGMVCRLLIESEQGPASIIAKFPSPAPENRAVAATYDMYGREVNFYLNAAQHVDLRVPECYYGAFDPETQDFILLIEDLKSYRVGDQVEGCSLDEAKAVMEAIAAYHASAWEPVAFDNVVLHDNPMQRDGMVAGFRMAWPTCLERFADIIPEAARTAAERFPDHIPRLLSTMCQQPLCLIHGDLRLDNVFFGKNEIVLVDWQAFCRSAPEQDVAYFVTQGLPRRVRDQADLHAHYHQHLAEKLSARGIDYSYAASRERYEIAALYLWCFAAVTSGMLDAGNARGLQLGREMLDGTLSLLDEMNAFARIS